MASKIIMVINPGSTSTKLALFTTTAPNSIEVFKEENSAHKASSKADSLFQFKERLRTTQSFLDGEGPLHIVVSRGGLTRPLEAGSYRVNGPLKADLAASRFGQHSSNLGALIADEIAVSRNIPAMIVDPVSVDQFTPLARYSGHPEIPRICQLHALNMRAVARKVAAGMGGRMEEFNFIIAHIGGGISVTPMLGGRFTDVNHALHGGPFSPRRSGGLPLLPLVEMCFSGRWADAAEAEAELTQHSGLMAYLGTDDGREIGERAAAGEEPWREVYEAMAYQIAKEIGAMAAVARGKVDRIILTGAMARPPLSGWIAERSEWIAPVELYTGEEEMRALAEAASRVLFGEEELLDYSA